MKRDLNWYIQNYETAIGGAPQAQYVRNTRHSPLETPPFHMTPQQYSDFKKTFEDTANRNRYKQVVTDVIYPNNKNSNTTSLIGDPRYPQVTQGGTSNFSAKERAKMLRAARTNEIMKPVGEWVDRNRGWLDWTPAGTGLMLADIKNDTEVGNYGGALASTALMVAPALFGGVTAPVVKGVKKAVRKLPAMTSGHFFAPRADLHGFVDKSKTAINRNVLNPIGLSFGKPSQWDHFYREGGPGLLWDAVENGVVRGPGDRETWTINGIRAAKEMFPRTFGNMSIYEMEKMGPLAARELVKASGEEATRFGIPFRTGSHTAGGANFNVHSPTYGGSTLQNGHYLIDATGPDNFVFGHNTSVGTPITKQGLMNARTDSKIAILANDGVIEGATLPIQDVRFWRSSNLAPGLLRTVNPYKEYKRTMKLGDGGWVLDI